MKKCLIAGLLVLSLLLSGCTQQQGGDANTQANDINLGTGSISAQKPVAETGDIVTVTYDGFYLDENLSPVYFDRREVGNPMKFTLGVDGMIDGFEEGVLGVAVGETRHLTIPPEKGYGYWDPELVKEFDTNELTLRGIEPVAGLVLPLQNGLNAKVLDVNADTNRMRIDFNHELAGKTIYFTVSIVSITKADAQVG